MQLLNYQIHTSADSDQWIVFLHGAGGSIATWNKQIAAFETDFNLLLIDLRDHGNSKDVQPEEKRYSFQMVSEDLKKVLDHVGLQQAHFVTLSFGSIIMQDFAMRFPTYINRILVVGGVFSGSFFIRLFVFTARFFNIFLTYKAMYSLFSYVLMPRKRNQKARKIYQMHATQLSQKEYLKWVGLYYEFFNLLRTYYKRNSEHPMLIIMGGDDYVFLDGARNLATSQPHTELQIIPKVGHIANIEAAEVFNEVARAFLLQPTTEKPMSRELYGTN
ncbi:MAG: alpha/beta hydrolase [Bacteroidota bacterium]